MEIKTFDGNIVETSVTKDYSDVSYAGASNTINLFQIPSNCTIIDVNMMVDEAFVGNESNDCIASVNRDLITKKNVTNLKETDGVYLDLSENPYFVAPTQWSVSAELLGRRAFHGSCGTISAGLCVGGLGMSYLDTSEEFNGTSWSAGGSLLSPRSHCPACGTQSASLVVGGRNSGTAYLDTCYWNSNRWCIFRRKI